MRHSRVLLFLGNNKNDRGRGLRFQKPFLRHRLGGGITSDVISDSGCCYLHHATTAAAASNAETVAATPRGRQRFYRIVDVVPCPAPLNTGVLDKKNKIQDGAQEEASLLLPRVPELSILLDENGNEKKVAPPPSSASSSSSSSSLSSLSWYTVTLDGRALKTPMAGAFAVPSFMLAHAIAAEWNTQHRHIQPTQMPLTTLACTALDQTCLPHIHNKYQSDSLNYLNHDTLCYWADANVERPLYQRQEQLWKPILDAFQQAWDCSVAMVQHDVADKNSSMIIPSSRQRQWNNNNNSSNISHLRLDHPVALQKACQLWISRLDAWHLTAFYSLVAETKSFLLAWALFTKNDAAIHLDTAVQASRVEEEFQISNWGVVEGGHDYDRLNCSIQLRAAVLFTEILDKTI